jgi:hypothetical protein
MASRRAHWDPTRRGVGLRVDVHFSSPCAKLYLRPDLGQGPFEGDVLRSTNSLQLGVPMTSIPSYGDKAFSVAAPKIWNDLPAGLGTTDELVCFGRLLKTFLFKEAFPTL